MRAPVFGRGPACALNANDVNGMVSNVLHEFLPSSTGQSSSIPGQECAALTTTLHVLALIPVQEGKGGPSRLQLGATGRI